MRLLLLGQELISYRSSSCSYCCWDDLFKKAYDSVVLNRTGMKFGRNVLCVNMHWLTESDFRLGVIILRGLPWRHFR